MRRFEFVEGSSAKFWSGFVEGSTFTVLFGRIGTAGQRKDKAFPTEEAARKELEKKIAEKVREGYKEVAGDGQAPAPAAAAEEPRAPQKRAPAPLPPRFRPRPATPEGLEAAAAALTALTARLGGRSWQVAQAARRARRALAAIAGAAPAGALAAALDGLLQRVGGERPRLPLRLALDLLAQLDASALERAQLWARSPEPVLALLREQREALGDPELALRLGRLLSERPDRGSAAALGRRWQALRPHLEGRVELAALAPSADAGLRRALARLDPA